MKEGCTGITVQEVHHGHHCNGQCTIGLRLVKGSVVYHGEGNSRDPEHCQRHKLNPDPGVLPLATQDNPDRLCDQLSHCQVVQCRLRVAKVLDREGCDSWKKEDQGIEYELSGIHVLVLKGNGQERTPEGLRGSFDLRSYLLGCIVAV